LITPDQTLELLSRMVVAAPTDDGVRVSTHVLYPSNGAVSVVVRGGEKSFQVSDDGGGVAELGSSGLPTVLSDRMIRAQLRTKGLRVRDGVIMSPIVPIDAIPAAIMLVANASRAIADWGLSHLSFAPRRNFREDLTALLGRHFHDNLKNDEAIVGKSNKPHRFGHVVYLHRDRKLLIDPVVNDASSINARLVANLDVRLMENPLISQIIVFDDRLKWKASDLRLLELGAPTVAFSSAEAEINRLAA
jgi:hypothetical protein